MNSKINIPIALKNIKNHFSPKIIGEVNDVYIKIVKILGEKVPWHNHQNEHELFYVIEVSLIFEIEGKDSFIMNEGDIFIIEKGVNHRVSSDQECKIMLVENKTTDHTGNVKSDITKNIDNQRQS
ncbi:cupin domain-containing protein [Flavobacterium degerlachei]|jgi:quercetin dioxygenase-like cupin family protein|uniref:Cupin domain-containing protein n=1 Tax=Flavobacterium degerlachei TaxID=229203 RepID=A0A1H3E4K3_9FLAO|nr:cupin domain-containing protein [Flavobacterium degerlachei]SDX73611.1 Cupin domain-containing protein [Flavobacterium degerlachei]